jgi:hypothetical protein
LEEYKLKHIRLTNKIKTYLKENGPKNTREIQDYCSSLRNKKTGSRSNVMFNQNMNVIGNLMRRKYFVKIGHDKDIALDIWEIKEEYK